MSIEMVTKEPLPVEEALLVETPPVAEIPQQAKPMRTESPKKKVEDWFAVKGTRLSLFRAAKKLNKWPIGRMLTEEQYAQGIELTKRHRIV